MTTPRNLAIFAVTCFFSVFSSESLIRTKDHPLASHHESTLLSRSTFTGRECQYTPSTWIIFFKTVWAKSALKVNPGERIHTWSSNDISSLSKMFCMRRSGSVHVTAVLEFQQSSGSAWRRLALSDRPFDIRSRISGLSQRALMRAENAALRSGVQVAFCVSLKAGSLHRSVVDSRLNWQRRRYSGSPHLCRPFSTCAALYSGVLQSSLSFSRCLGEPRVPVILARRCSISASETRATFPNRALYSRAERLCFERRWLGRRLNKDPQTRHLTFVWSIDKMITLPHGGMQWDS